MKMLNVNIPGKTYTIYIEGGILDKIGCHIKSIYKREKIVIITDENVDKLYAERLERSLQGNGFKVNFIVVKPGENSKSMDTLKDVYSKLLDLSITRGDLIVAFGGGIVGDLTGFAASTLLRGIPFIQIPTSLLAQIDSSVGGKVAINLEEGKNLVGSFYQPKAVFIDSDLLQTLDNRYFNDGMGEVIKYGCISDKDLFEKLWNYKTPEELLLDIDEIIYRCLDTKRKIVELDELDNSIRMILNFGHTIGHAVEKHYNYERYSHGEAVAIGMYNITRKSEALGLTQSGTSDLIKEILKKYKLPYKIEDINIEEMKKSIPLDKKNLGDDINIILLEKIGRAFIKKIKLEEMIEYI